MRTREGLSPEEQYALLLDGLLTPDEVDADLVRLAAAVSPLRETALATPDDNFRLELRHRIGVAAADAAIGPVQRVRDAFWERTARIRNSMRAATAAAVTASMLASGGVAAAAQHALPGELLYPVKQATESVRLALAGNLEAVGALNLAFAEERLDEIAQGADTIASTHLIDAFEDMDDSSSRGAGALLEVFDIIGEGRLIDDLLTFVDGQRAGLGDTMSSLPTDVIPFAEDALELLRRIEAQALAAACSCDPDGDGPATAPTNADGSAAVPRPGDAPASGSPTSGCDCTPAEAPRPPREPVAPAAGDAGDAPPADTPPGTSPPPGDRDPAPEDPEDTRIVVPHLPGPLDGVGEAVDDAIADLLDGSGVPPPSEGPPVDPLAPPQRSEGSRIGGTDDVG